MIGKEPFTISNCAGCYPGNIPASSAIYIFIYIVTKNQKGMHNIKKVNCGKLNEKVLIWDQHSSN